VAHQRTLDGRREEGKENEQQRRVKGRGKRVKGNR
jgi:hypothetical protein